MAFALAPTRLSGGGALRSAPVSVAVGLALVVAHLGRIPAPGFVTTSFSGLLLSLIAVVVIGRFVERRLGHGATFAILLLSTVGAIACAALASWLFGLAGVHMGWGHLTWDRVQGYVNMHYHSWYTYAYTAWRAGLFDVPPTVELVFDAHGFTGQHTINRRTRAKLVRRDLALVFVTGL